MDEEQFRTSFIFPWKLSHSLVQKKVSDATPSNSMVMKYIELHDSFVLVLFILDIEKLVIEYSVPHKLR